MRADTTTEPSGLHVMFCDQKKRKVSDRDTTNQSGAEMLKDRKWIDLKPQIF